MALWGFMWQLLGNQLKLQQVADPEIDVGKEIWFVNRIILSSLDI